nr:MAG TPA: hypothetical protein [Caudoviricetes sp.]
MALIRGASFSGTPSAIRSGVSRAGGTSSRGGSCCGVGLGRMSASG